jgi:hypothetical protein
MQGYYTPSGYKGLVGGQWMMFPTEAEYAEYMEEMCT